MSDNIKLLLVGSGNMALEYAKILSSLSVPFDVIGRSEKRVNQFKEAFPNINVLHGGLEKFAGQLSNYTHAIIASNVVSLSGNAKTVIENGIKFVLVEKPGIASPQEIETLKETVTKHNPKVFIAYNRRFLASVLKAQEMIDVDGGVTSMHFEFTEWANIIEKLECDPLEKEYLFLANSSHVADLAFYFAGIPQEMSCYTKGKLDWHPAASMFAGCGITKNNVLFSYHSNWQSAGRWSLEVMTQNHRFIFKPLEKLQIQVKNSVAINFCENIDYSLDEQFKPGLFIQVKKFVTGDFKNLCSLEEQFEKIPTYRKICNY